MKIKILFCLLVTLSVFSASAQSGAEWNAYKAANGINSSYTYQGWIDAGMPRGGGGNGGGYSGPSAAEIAAEQAAAAQRQREAAATAENDQGFDAYKNEDWDTAADDFQKALQIFPNNQVYLKNLAQTQARQGEKARGKNDYTTAIDYFQKALANDPNDQDIRASLDTAKNHLESSERGKTMADNVRQSIQKVAQNVNTTAAAGGLDFDGDKTGNAPTTPISDPMVVDARNVPSGLPKSVDAAIPHTPAGDGMRKGYEAIQAGDWKVALAWFQDALNKEPGDPDLQRLIDLSQFTLVYRSQSQTPTAGNNSTPSQAAQSPIQDNRIYFPGGEAAKPGESILALNAANSTAGRARAEIAFEEYNKKYGDANTMKNIRGRIAVEQAAQNGEGYTKEELREQLRQALKDYHDRHDNRPAEPIGDPPSADEIILGGRG